MADAAEHHRQSMYCHGCHFQWQTEGQGIECPSCNSTSTEIVCSQLQLQIAEDAADWSRQLLTEALQVTADNHPHHFHSGQQEPAPAPQPVPSQNMDNTDGPTPSGSPHSPDNPTSTTDNSMGQDTDHDAANGSEGHDTGVNSAADGHATDDDRHDRPFFGHPSYHMHHHFMMQPTFFFTTFTQGTGPQMITMQFFPSGGYHVHATADDTPAEQHQGQESQTQSQDGAAPQSPFAQDSPLFGPNSPIAGGFLGALMSLFNPANFNPANAIFGDAVYSQEAYDRIMTQLRDQAAPGGAPPASKTAIDHLEVKEVDDVMLEGDGDGSTRCVICVDEMVKGEQAWVLPCSHFFHGDCVKPWLEQHNTCPVCRRSIEEDVKLPTKIVDDAPEQPLHHHEATTGTDCL
ncbi:hypothetical protein B0T24DRAFT_120136 [Lasiosphaeria ovina]|uniref:RING-type E3 ubiquitin transferase n=1 Tax=Lasiosphaeria ovina TaxID=92902 RepID=A0AAE0JSE4_9PEZI|nr:hypothetical protein B0T24DRAFT_120136 [Lasiosphaeria ovina]